MLDWLTWRKRTKELPEYSALHSVPSRELPPDLADTEASESFATRRRRRTSASATSPASSNRGSAHCSRHECPCWRRCEQDFGGVAACRVKMPSLLNRLHDFPSRPCGAN